jgi:hypothetical protein
MASRKIYSWKDTMFSKGSEFLAPRLLSTIQAVPASEVGLPGLLDCYLPQNGRWAGSSLESRAVPSIRGWNKIHTDFCAVTTRGVKGQRRLHVQWAKQRQAFALLRLRTGQPQHLAPATQAFWQCSSMIGFHGATVQKLYFPASSTGHGDPSPAGMRHKLDPSFTIHSRGPDLA